jgi:hypothetical protein
MLTNLNDTQSDSNEFDNFDIAIIGAGAAGITLAHKLSSNGKHVALVEAGDYDFHDASQACYEGKVVGDPYYDLNTARLRFFGGTTNHWGGWCRTFDPVDFERGYLGPEYEWPINKKEIDAYLHEACNILEITPDFNDSSSLNSNIKTVEFKFSPPVRFREKYFNQLIKNEKIHVFLNANLVDISGDSNKIETARFKSFNNKNLAIKAKKYAFCMGGIENSRFLLWFQQKYGEQFFTNSPALGKYWMEHPHYTLGRALVNKDKVSERFYSLNGKQQKDLSILNCGLRVQHLNSEGTKELIREVMCLAPKLGSKLADMAGKDLVCGANFRAAWEQAPRVENKISLDKETDQFGIPKSILYWKKYPLDRKTITQSIAEFNRWLLEIDAGRVQLQDWLLNEEDYPENDEIGGFHHMGGTRMHKDPQFGVVDQNCKVFGSENLYIAGSSIFTTSGHNNPTLPIIQLTLRLADKLSDL